MTRFQTIDFEKAGLLRKYLGKATLKLSQRDRARAELAEQLGKLRKIAGKDMEHDLVVLESKISKALEQEKRILTHLKEEDHFHAQLREKVHNLDKKLEAYLKTNTQRTSRIKELEEKIKDHHKSKRRKLKELKDDLKLLERLRLELKSDKEHTERVKLVTERIDEIKKRIKKLEP